MRALADELSSARNVHLDVSQPKQWDTSVGVEVWMPAVTSEAAVVVVTV